MHKKGINRDQLRLICWGEHVDQDSPARHIDKFVDEMDTSYFEKSIAKETGRPPYEPKDMLKLYLYGMENNVFSSRKLERECKRNIEVKWMLHDLQPKNKAISDFRLENKEHLAKFFQHFTKKLVKDGHIDGLLSGLDGTKLRANNSKKANYTKASIAKRIEYLDKRIAEYMKELDKNDKAEELQEKKEKLISHKTKIESGEVTQVSTTDPDSRLMRMGNGGKDVSHNVQAVVDSKHKLISGFKVCSDENDQKQLHTVLKETKDNLGFDKMTVTTDKGYYNTNEIKKCHDDNIETLVPKPNREKGDKENYIYDRENDTYTSPEGDVFRFRTICMGTHREYTNRQPGQKKGFRSIAFHIHYDHEQRNAQMLAKHPDIYKQRKELCEHPFGTIKKTMGFTQFLTRGNSSVTAESALVFTAYNLKRLRKIEKEATISQKSLLARLFTFISHDTQKCFALAA